MDIIKADVNDVESIEAMCAQTRVIIDVVGPVCKLICNNY